MHLNEKEFCQVRFVLNDYSKMEKEGLGSHESTG
jgi:hypothetical protein